MRQQSLVTATGAVVQQWRTFDSLGQEAATTPPSDSGSTGFVPYSDNNAATLHASFAYHDSRGRVVDRVLADGREMTTQYAVGRTTSVDARQTPKDVYTDAFGRVTAVDEYYLSSLDTSGTFTEYRSSFVRDTAGNVLQATNADGHVRRFTYNEAGQVVTAEAPHAAGAAPTQIDTYTMCYDGDGRSTRTASPEGRTVTQFHDELGRLTVRTAAPSGDTTTYSYDDPAIPNGLGRVSTIANAHATDKTLAYDVRGNALQHGGQLAARASLERNTFAKVDDISASVAHASAAFDNAGVVGTAVSSGLTSGTSGAAADVGSAAADVHPTFKPGPYAGESIPARSTAQKFSAEERSQVNRIGEESGCHTCGSPTPGTKSGNWVPDHQPPSATAVPGTPQRLYPQCINCSREQGLAVARQLKGQQP